MPIDEETLTELEKQVPALAARAVRQAYEEAIASGSGIVVAQDGAIYEVFRDGSRNFIKYLPAPTPAIVGQTLVLP